MNDYENARLEWDNSDVFKRGLLMAGIGRPEMSDLYVKEHPWKLLDKDTKRQVSALISYREVILNRYGLTID